MFFFRAPHCEKSEKNHYSHKRFHTVYQCICDQLIYCLYHGKKLACCCYMVKPQISCFCYQDISKNIPLATHQTNIESSLEPPCSEKCLMYLLLCPHSTVHGCGAQCPCGHHVREWPPLLTPLKLGAGDDLPHGDGEELEAGEGGLGDIYVCS